MPTFQSGVPAKMGTRNHHAHPSEPAAKTAPAKPTSRAQKESKPDGETMGFSFRPDMTNVS